MRKFKVHMETPYAGVGDVEEFEIEDDATEEEIEEVARELFFNYYQYGIEEIKERDSDEL